MGGARRPRCAVGRPLGLLLTASPPACAAPLDALRHFVVDHARHDTTSIVATPEHRFRLQPLGPRDAAVRDLATAPDAPAAP